MLTACGCSARIFSERLCLTSDRPVGRGLEGDTTVQEIGDKKGRIVEAAREIFAERPYDRVKVEAIAERAGVGKGTIYEYFVSKEELVAVILEAGFQQYFMTLAAAAAPSVSVGDSCR